MGEQDCLGQSCDRWETGPTVGAGIIETPSEQLNGRLVGCKPNCGKPRLRVGGTQELLSSDASSFLSLVSLASVSQMSFLLLSRLAGSR